MNKRIYSLTAVLLSCLTTIADAQSAPSRSYIVQLRDAPAATYAGGVPGLKATKPLAGQRLNVSASDVQAYIGYVAQKQNAVLSAASTGRVMHRYSTVFNGFAAVMTEAQAQQLKARSDVLSVRIDELRKLSTSYTPVFLGLDKPSGLWPQLGGKSSAGEGVIVGVIDSGIAPDNPAFADRVDDSGNPSFTGNLAYGPPPASWKGTCETGPGFSPTHCNHKLIGARVFREYFDSIIAAAPPDISVGFDPSEFVSARDSIGHGSHTASIAAGNHGVTATFNGGVIGKTSGMAPRARLAVYKVCFSLAARDATTGEFSSLNSCPTSESLAAVEQAVKDGVQVINFSIGGTSDAVATDLDVAFLGASNAGVFVAAAGGNSGPGLATATAPAEPVVHVAPWITTVAASTHDREFVGSTQLGNGSTFTGASVNTVALPKSPLIRGADAGSAFCQPGSLTPALVTGKVVVCYRGQVPLLQKSDAVKAAGGVGMLLLNVAGGPDDAYALSHSVPTVHLTISQYEAIDGYAHQTGARAAIGIATPVYGKVAAPMIANFSSRGPNPYDPGLLKPDLAAPGLNIIASFAATLTPAEHDAVANGTASAPATFAVEQGTSMASPHVAGVAALLIQKHPGWSPSAIKSALMTTAFATKPDAYEGTPDAGTLPWGQGAGQIDPTRAADPGLVYLVPPADYERYICGTGYAANFCAGLAPLKSADLNQPAITLPAVIGKATITRSVTNVSDSPSTYNWNATLPGFEVGVVPAVLSVAPGETKSFTITLARTTANDGPNYGSFSWSDGQHVVRSPLTISSKALAAPASVFSSAATGSKVFTVGTGVSGRLELAPLLTAQTVSTGTVRRTCYDQLSCSSPASSFMVNVDVPVGAASLLTAIYKEDYSALAALGVGYQVFNPDGVRVKIASFYSPTATTLLQNPQPGTWKVYFYSTFLPPEGLIQGKVYTAVTVPGKSPAGNMKAFGPGTAYLGGTASVGLSWQSLAPDTRYVGQLDYFVNGKQVGTTGISIDTTKSLTAPQLTIPMAAR